MVQNRDETAERLSDAHFQIDPDIERIFRVVAANGSEEHETEPIKLLEVNPNTPKGGIQPVYFGAHPSKGNSYPSIIIEIHPDELEELSRGSLELPNDWRVGQEYRRRDVPAHS